MKLSAADARSWRSRLKLQPGGISMRSAATFLTGLARRPVFGQVLRLFHWRHPPFSLTLLAAILVIMLSLVLVLDAADDRVHALDTAKTAVSNHAHILASHAADTLNAVDRMAEKAAARVAAQLAGANPGADPEPSISTLLEAAMITTPGIDEIAYIDGRGVFRAGYWRSAKLRIACGETCSFVKRNLASPNKFYFGPVDGLPDGSVRYGISRPVRGAGGTLAGVVLAILDPSYFAIEFGNGGDDATDTVALFDAGQRMIAGWSPNGDGEDNAIGRVMAEFATTMRAMTESHVVVATPDDIVGVHKMNAFPLWLGVARSKHAALRAWRGELLTHVLLTIGIDCLALLFMMIIARQFSQLRRVEASLQSAHDELETRVHERTAELQKEIHSRERIETSLRASEDRFLQFMKNIPAGVYMKDETGRYTFVNPQFAEIYGVDFGRCLGRTGFDLLPPALAAEDHERDREVLEGTGTVSHEVAFERDDGVHNMAVFKFPIDLPSGQRLIGGVTLDITKRRTAERLLWHAQKMEALGQLAVGLAHDFNNLLFIILGNLEMIKDDTADGTATGALVDEACWAARHGADLTTHLLTVFRKRPSTREYFDAAAVIANMSGLLSRTLGNGIDVDIRAEEQPLPIVVDPTWFENAVLNLALNARDAMPKGGRLLIKVASSVHDHEWRGWRSTLAAGSYVTVSFSDAGTGMAPDVMERMFEPFFTTKAAAKGSGLGLSMVYRFVTEFGGDIHVESTLGKGTTVTLILPLAAARDAAGKPPPAMPRRFAVRGERILIVEDEAKERRLAAAMLKGLGYRTCEAEDGTRALAMLREGLPVDLLLADIALPGGIDGIELALQAQTLRPGLRVQLMSGHIRDLTKDDGVAAELPLLRKPFDKARLAEAVCQALGGAANDRPVVEPAGESVG